MSNLIDFTKNGGYRFKQFTLRKMQEAYLQQLAAFIAFCGIPNTGSYIIAGMQVEDDNILSGYCFIDGELCYFEQTEGTLATKIKKNVVIQALGFKNGNNENVFRFVNAVTDVADGVLLSQFVRISPVFDALYLRFSQAEKDKLAGIEAGAEVNVQADWNEASTISDAFIRNKPAIISPLKIDYVLGISDINVNAVYPVSWSSPLSTANYQVVGSFKAQTLLSPNSHNNLTWSTNGHTVNGFNLLIHETAGTAQNVRFDFMLIPN